MRRIIECIHRFITTIEEIPVSLFGWVLSFFSIILIRFFLEAFSSPNITGYITSDATTNVHFAIFYISTALALTLVLSVATSRDPRRVAKVVLCALPLIWISPLVDLALSGGARMTYIFERPAQLLYDFVTFFGPVTPVGVTMGLRIEIAIMLFAIALYSFSVTRSVFRSVASVLTSYAVIFLSAILPSLVVAGSSLGGTTVGAWWYMLNHGLVTSASFHPTSLFSSTRFFELLFNMGMIQVWFVILVLLLERYVLRAFPHIHHAVLANVRPARLVHYVGLFLLGAGFAAIGRTGYTWIPFDAVTMLVGGLTVAFAWISAVALNDCTDISIDRMSNTQRPLVTGEISQGEMRNVAVVTGALALLGGFALGSYSLFFISMYLASSFVYSVPPLRLRRFLGVSNALIGVASLAIVLLGFFLVSEDRHLSAFPASYALMVVMIFTFGTTMKDLKDVAGDGAHGVWTIPVVFGERVGRLIVGGLLFLSFMLVPVFLPKLPLLIPSALAGLILWIGVARGKGERLIFTVYFGALAVFVAFLFFFQ